MKNTSLLKCTGLLFLFLFVFWGCAKEPNQPAEENTTVPVTPPRASFTWRISGGATVTADETYFVPAYNNIVANKIGSKSVDIILESLAKGAHTISPSNGITLDYQDGSTAYTGKSGSVLITETSATLVSGSFTCALQGGGATSTITGEFSNVPKK